MHIIIDIIIDRSDILLQSIYFKDTIPWASVLKPQISKACWFVILCESRKKPIRACLDSQGFYSLKSLYEPLAIFNTAIHYCIRICMTEKKNMRYCILDPINNYAV